ncbi:ATPase involved in DNA replication initiation [Desulfosporosinus acidiphilus SJ4]|uniref:ATPase involved in DNA replication initiation n=1 Tax=Desulfosporosinus acidiphilus (strain DSM 22704 / JCM 16185 / SJ4) TaxID=646529 RepID=I4D872_DESAJ|nr:DnaA/Hda family protein [Desulfosporosinus acidiphilus]AFM41996.1 ATPase involved in DNA replication initiation [Desulfosporosinus acidiphilus SJ4]
MNWFLSDFNIKAWRFINHYEPATAPSMTLVYGPAGVGKSSLLKHVEQTWKNEGSLLIDAASFSRQYAFASQENRLLQFRRSYRAVPLLLLDDLQGLAGKKQTIEEIHYTYEYILQNGGKMMAVVETELLNLTFLGERLMSRLLSGVVIPLARPQEYEIEAFIEEYSHRLLLSMDSAIPEFIARQTTSLAEAKKVLRQFIDYAELYNDELSVQCFLSYWREQARKQSQEKSPMNILRVTAQITGHTPEELVGPAQKPSINEARQLAIYTVRMLCKLSYPEIAVYFNRRHTTIIAAYKKMQEKLLQDQALFRRYQEITGKFKEDHKKSFGNMSRP